MTDQQPIDDHIPPTADPSAVPPPTPEEGAYRPDPETSTFEDYQTGFRFSVESAASAVCELRRQVEDGIMTLLPVDVTKHLINSQKELVMAGKRLVEITNESTQRYTSRVVQTLDEKAKRAEELHRKAEAEKRTDEFSI